MLSAGCEYGIRAVLYLQSVGSDRPMPVAEIARETNISPSFLAKIVQRLVAAGLLVTGKGPGGGVRLARSATEITLLDVVRAIDGLEFKSRCVLGFPNCNDEVPCPVHHHWGPLREEMADMFESSSLKEFAEKMTPEVKRRLHNPGD